MAFTANHRNVQDVPRSGWDIGDFALGVLGRNVGSVAGQVRDLVGSGLFDDRLRKAMARGVGFFHMVENRIDKAVNFVVGDSESD
ncbi:hypothetical protein N0V88_004943 [Collariella sp. IMI 366227]|nr:hypothetical protein N0V88_004943 [Collariella sp. IMI 366227]